MFTSTDRTTNDEAFVIGSPGFESNERAYHDPLEDVFGSAPGSPLLTHQGDDHNDQADTNRLPTAEPSDVPRLRSIHVTNGYREGIAIGKEQAVQAGFDEGYALGAEYGSVTGWIKGVLEGLILIAMDDTQRAELDDILQSAKTELAVGNLFSTAYFGSDGIWIYDVPDQSVDGITFRTVALAHPLLMRWRKSVVEIAAKHGLALS